MANKSLPEETQDTSPAPMDSNEGDKVDSKEEPQTVEELKELLQKNEELLQKNEELLKKSEEDKENYKKGMMKYKKIPEKESQYVTKSELYKSNEKTAIDKMTAKHSDLNDNWEEVIKYYTPRRGKSSSDEIESDINDALTLWKSYRKKDDTTDQKKANSDLTTSSSKTQSTKTKSTTPAESKKFKILNTGGGVDSWYK